jgi:GNAT superfamily N-acetyltransferase
MVLRSGSPDGINTVSGCLQGNNMTPEIDNASYELRSMCSSDLEQAHELTRKLNWPHRLEDWQMMLAVSEAVVLLCNGELIGTACATLQGPYASLGLIVVADAYQGKGLGRRLMEAIMVKAGERQLVLNATVAGEPLYTKLGFHRYGEVEQYQAIVPEITTSGFDVDSVTAQSRIRLMQPQDKTAVLGLMNVASGMDRQQIGEAVFAVAHEMWVVERFDRIVGFSASRPFGRGVAIGPVIAQDALQAKQLITRHLATHQGQFVRIDTPKQLGLGLWLASIGLKQVDCVSQMVCGNRPEMSGDYIQYALVTQAIG